MTKPQKVRGDREQRYMVGKKIVSVRLRLAVYEKLKANAAKRGSTVHQTIVHLIENEINQ